jgi:hypothetical protein
LKEFIQLTGQNINMKMKDFIIGFDNEVMLHFELLDICGSENLYDLLVVVLLVLKFIIIEHVSDDEIIVVLK